MVVLWGGSPSSSAAHGHSHTQATKCLPGLGSPTCVRELPSLFLLGEEFDEKVAARG